MVNSYKFILNKTVTKYAVQSIKEFMEHIKQYVESGPNFAKMVSAKGTILTDLACFYDVLGLRKRLIAIMKVSS